MREERRQPPIARIRRVSGTPRALSGPLAIRLARTEDIAECADVWATSIADYLAELNLPTDPGDLAPIRRMLGHLMSTDPGRFWVATRPSREPAEEAPGAVPERRQAGAGDGSPERVVAFASASIRGDVWFLAMLFVMPDEQAAGLGRELLERVLPARVAARMGVRPGGPAGPDGPSVFATATDSAQPISNALYARYGIVPRMPVYRLTGRPRDDRAMPPLPSTVQPVAFEEIAVGPPGGPGHRELVRAVAAIDRQLLGYEHADDHRFHRLEGRVGYLYRSADGTPVAYGYASPVGRVGPVGALDEALLAPVVGHLLDAIPPRGASAIWVPGAAGGTFQALLKAGFRLDGFPTLLCWSRPFAAFERYIPSSLALL